MNLLYPEENHSSREAHHDSGCNLLHTQEGRSFPSDLVFKNGVARIVKSQKARQKKHAGGESGGELEAEKEEEGTVIVDAADSAEADSESGGEDGKDDGRKGVDLTV